jgi:hypothetical protein
MNDSELITAVRESVTGVHTATPVDQIEHRGRALRGRRRLPGLAAVMALAAGAALAANALVSSGQHPASSQLPAQLAAWTVTRQADGNIRVTIRELRDPAGLQRTLRADGVPASVTFLGQLNLACRPYQGGDLLWSRVYKLPGGDDNLRVVVIHPSGLPSGAGVQIGAGTHHHLAPPGGIRHAFVALSLVQRSPRCTGT